MIPSIKYNDVQGNYTINNPLVIAPTNTGGAPILRTKVTTLSGATNNSVYVFEGAGSVVTYKFPSAIAVSLSGISYVADEYAPIIRKILPDGTTSVLAGSTNFSGASFTGYGNIDGLGSVARFQAIRGMVTDNNGNIFITDGVYVRKVTPSGAVTTIAGNGTSAHIDGATGSLKNPLAITINKTTGDLFITDESRIKKVTQSGVITTISGGGMGNANGAGLLARFRNPRGITIDNVGNLYVSDTENGVVKKIDILNNVTTITISGLNIPTGIVYNNEDLFVNDAFNNIILKVDSLSISSKYAGSGFQSFKDGFSTTNRAGAGFYGSEGLSVDGNGTLYVADKNNQKIRKVEAVLPYTITPNLPTGLILNGITGVVSGTPTQVTPSKIYTVTGSNYEGTSSTTISFGII
jgi:hypothetical protein